MTKCCPSFLLHKESILIVSKNIKNILRKVVLNIALAASLSSVAALLHAGGTNVPKQVQCLAEGAYFESRGQGDRGMLATMHVIMNRVKDGNFANTPCSVIAQPKQFSYRGKGYKVKEPEVHQRALELAQEVISGKRKDFTGNATYFHANSVKPSWTKKMNCTIKIGNHLYYKPIK